MEGSGTADQRWVPPDSGEAAKAGAGQTRRRLRGRQPLCGIGVMSRIALMEKPTACRARKIGRAHV